MTFRVLTLRQSKAQGVDALQMEWNIWNAVEYLEWNGMEWYGMREME